MATERSQYDIDPPAAGLAHALSPSLVRSHTLAPLTDTAAVELVRAAFPSASPRWTADCLSAGAGSPLLLRALLDDLGAMAPEALPPTVPDTCAALYPGAYPAVVQWWLDSAGPATAEVAQALAALELTGPSTAGEEATVAPAGGAAGRPADVTDVTDVTDSIDVTDVADSIDGVGEERPGAAGFPAPDSVDLLAETVGADPRSGRRVAHRDGVAGGAARRCRRAPAVRASVAAGRGAGRVAGRAAAAGVSGGRGGDGAAR
ncbi:hypothetical protein SALBM311S_06779 [Streptomyces alboniger]